MIDFIATVIKHNVSHGRRNLCVFLCPKSGNGKKIDIKRGDYHG